MDIVYRVSRLECNTRLVAQYSDRSTTKIPTPP